MNYKKDIRYRIGVGLAVTAVADMVITFIMMGFGSAPAILWFFVGGAVLVIANFILVSVRRKYENADLDGPTNAEIAKENLSNAKNFLFKRGAAGAVLFILLIIVSLATVVMGCKTLNTKYQKSGAMNAGYHFNLREAERYKGLMEEELEKGNEKLAEEFRLSSEKCLEESEWYLEYHGELTEKLDRQIYYLIITATVNAAVLIVYIAFIVSHKKKNRSRKI